MSSLQGIFFLGPGKCQEKLQNSQTQVKQQQQLNIPRRHDRGGFALINMLQQEVRFVLPGENGR